MVLEIPSGSGTLRTTLRCGLRSHLHWVISVTILSEYFFFIDKAVPAVIEMCPFIIRKYLSPPFKHRNAIYKGLF